MKKYSLILSIIGMLSTAYIYPFSFKSLYSVFSRERFEEVEQQEIPIEKQSKLIIENTTGPIHIQGWQQQKIQLKYIKHAAKQELLPNISVAVQSSNDRINIKTVFSNETTGSVEYALLVPASISLNIKGESIPVKLEHVNGLVLVHNEYGNVELHDIQGPTTVEVGTKGSIIIEQAGNSVKAITHNGNIDIHDAKKSVFASTDSGKIRTSCKTIPNDSIIKLDAPGQIVLQLPSGTNAEIQAETEQGCILCDHYLTLKPLITQLNSKAWTQFKRNINGTLGSGNAKLSLHSVSGNIKIIKTTV